MEEEGRREGQSDALWEGLDQWALKLEKRARDSRMQVPLEAEKGKETDSSPEPAAGNMTWLTP